MCTKVVEVKVTVVRTYCSNVQPKLKLKKSWKKAVSC